MLNKRALLATSAIALLGAGQAQAGDGFYISVLGGANFQQSKTATPLFFTSDTLSPDTGFLIGGAVGVHADRWLKGLRAEVEASYRRNNFHGSWGSFLSEGVLHANTSTFAVMANVWYDIDIGMKWKPYVGGGAGWARAHADGALITTSGAGTNTEPFSVDRSGFAWQLGAGLNYEVQDGVKLGLGYRFFRGPNLRTSPFFGKNDNAALNFDNDNHSVLVSLTIDTN